MPNFSKLTSLAFVIAVANQVNHLTSAHVLPGKDGDREMTTTHRRHLLEDGNECVLYLKEVEFEDPTLNESSWSCEVPRDQARRFGGVDIMGIQGVSKEWIDAHYPISGESIMKTQGAYVQKSITTGETKIIVPNEASISIESLSEEDPRHHRQRRQNLGSKVSGTKKTLVIRVIDGNNEVIAASKKQLEDDVFLDPVCLKSQYAACSHNQLIIEQATNIDPLGVIDMKVDNVANTNAIESEARARAIELYNADTELDLVLFCMPDVGDWIGYGYYNRFDSWYKGPWCQSVSLQMHEVGHNFNMEHSGLGNDRYGDESGIMGYSFDEDDTPRMCFNPAKNYQLGWYSLQQVSINPLEYIGNPQTYVLNGINEYDTNGNNNNKIVLRLEQDGDTNIETGIDFYVGYNHANGINVGTRGSQNKVVVLQKNGGGPFGRGTSLLLASLSPGDSYVIPNLNGSSVVITFQSVTSDLKDATIKVTVNEDPIPTQAPSVSPPTTTIPTSATTYYPTSYPTSYPTYYPTYYPTSGDDQCVDDPNYKYKNDKKKTCKKWVAKGTSKLNKKKKRKLKKKCKKKWKKQRVWDSCPATCALVNLGPCAVLML
uniref:Peptidase M11 gametolysin domain-containing protein n=2 Tax=Pseudo-nitzschia australis TaxID=44445 RepID=A0A7S4EL53_9STRA